MVPRATKRGRTGRMLDIRGFFSSYSFGLLFWGWRRVTSSWLLGPRLVYGLVSLFASLRGSAVVGMAGTSLGLISGIGLWHWRCAVHLVLVIGIGTSLGNTYLHTYIHAYAVLPSLGFLLVFGRK